MKFCGSMLNCGGCGPIAEGHEAQERLERMQSNDKNLIRLPRQYTIKTRKRLIFKDFLELLRAIYYPFTTFENLKN